MDPESLEEIVSAARRLKTWSSSLSKFDLTKDIENGAQELNPVRLLVNTPVNKFNSIHLIQLI